MLEDKAGERKAERLASRGPWAGSWAWWGLSFQAQGLGRPASRLSNSAVGRASRECKVKALSTEAETKPDPAPQNHGWDSRFMSEDFLEVLPPSLPGPPR